MLLMRKSEDLLDILLYPFLTRSMSGWFFFVLRKNGRGDGYAIAAAFFFLPSRDGLHRRLFHTGGRDLPVPSAYLNDPPETASYISRVLKNLK